MQSKGIDPVSQCLTIKSKYTKSKDTEISFKMTPIYAPLILSYNGRSEFKTKWSLLGENSIGVFPKWVKFSLNSANSVPCLSPVSSWHCGSMLVTPTRGGCVAGSSPFTVINYFCHWIELIHWKHLEKLYHRAGRALSSEWAVVL